MKGLLIKDFMLGKRQFIMMGLFGIIMIGFGVLGVLSIYYGNFHSLIADMGLTAPEDIKRLLLLYSFFLGCLAGSSVENANHVFWEDDKAGFGAVSSSLPVSEEQRVGVRYIYYTIWLISILAFNLLFQPILYWTAGIPFNTEACLMIFSGMSIGTIIALVSMPFMYRFGIRIKPLISIGIVVLGIVVVVYCLNRIIQQEVSFDIIEEWVETVRNSLAILFWTLVLFGIPMSAMCSIVIQRRRKNQLW